jgi:hypothetical protein
MIDKIKPISSFGQIPDDKNNLKKIILIAKSEIVFFYFTKNEFVSVEVFKNIAQNLSSLLDLSTIDGCKSNIIVLDNPNFTIAPKNIISQFDKDSAAEIFFGSHNQKTFLNTDSQEIDFVFQCDNELASLLTEKLPSVNVTHFSQYFFQNIFGNVDDQQNAFYDIRDGYFFAFLTENKNIKLFNAYQYSDKNEFGFFGLGALHNSNFDVKSVKLQLTGFLSDDSPLQQLLSKYIESVSQPKYDLPNPILNPYYQVIKYFQSANY